MAPLIVSSTTGAPAVWARAGHNVHVAIKTLYQRKFSPVVSLPRDERRSKCSPYGVCSVALSRGGRAARDRSTFIGRRTSKPNPLTLYWRGPKHAARCRGSFSNGDTMSRKSLLSLMAVASLCSALPAWSQNLPEGKGKEIAADKCSSCHALEARVGNGYTAKGWATAVRMMTNHGVPLSKEEIATLTPYLAKNYPEKNKAAAVVVKGPLKVSMKSWLASTPGARPHDPLAARDGSLWYSGQMANVLGRV